MLHGIERPVVKGKEGWEGDSMWSRGKMSVPETGCWFLQLTESLKRHGTWLWFVRQQASQSVSHLSKADGG